MEQPKKTNLVLTALPWTVVPVILGAVTFYVMASNDQTLPMADANGITPETARFFLSSLIALLGGIFQSPILEILKKAFPTTGNLPAVNLDSLKNLINEVGGLTDEEKVKFNKMSDDVQKLRLEMADLKLLVTPVPTPTPVSQ